MGLLHWFINGTPAGWRLGEYPDSWAHPFLYRHFTLSAEDCEVEIRFCIGRLPGWRKRNNVEVVFTSSDRGLAVPKMHGEHLVAFVETFGPRLKNVKKGEVDLDLEREIENWFANAKEEK